MVEGVSRISNIVSCLMQPVCCSQDSAIRGFDVAWLSLAHITSAVDAQAGHCGCRLTVQDAEEVWHKHDTGCHHNEVGHGQAARYKQDRLGSTVLYPAPMLRCMQRTAACIIVQGLECDRCDRLRPQFACCLPTISAYARALSYLLAVLHRSAVTAGSSFPTLHRRLLQLLYLNRPERINHYRCTPLQTSIHHAALHLRRPPCRRRAQRQCENLPLCYL